MDREIDKVIKILGSQAALARALNLSDNAVCKWVAQGFIPPGRAIEVVRLIESLGKAGRTSKTKSAPVSLEKLLAQSYRYSQKSTARNKTKRREVHAKKATKTATKKEG